MRFWSVSLTWETIFYKVFSYSYSFLSIWLRNILLISLILLLKLCYLKRSVDDYHILNYSNLGTRLRMVERRSRVRVMTFELYILPILLFIISMLGISINRSSIIMILLCFEMMLLSIILSLLFGAYNLDAELGQISSIFIMTMAAVESAIGLSIMIVFSKLKGSVAIRFLNILRG